jgi:protein TonB
MRRRAMFEVVSADRGSGDSVQRTGTVIGSVAVHLAILGGVLLLPTVSPRRPDRGRAEEVKYFDIPALKLPAGASRSGAAPGSSGPDALKSAADRSRNDDALVPPARIPDNLPQALPDVAGTPGGVGVSGDTIATTLLSSLADAAAERASEAARHEPVELSALGEMPRLSNPRTMAEWWSELYPTRLLLRGVEGQAIVTFIIEMDGRVSSLKILSSTHPDFGRATLRGARRMRFRPARLGGQPVRVRAVMPVQWVLPRV